jgi:hypothetical protein
MLLGHYLVLLERSQRNLAAAFRSVADTHRAEADVARMCGRFAGQCDAHETALGPFAGRYGDEAGDEPAALHGELYHGPREGPLALLRDLHDLYLMTSECDLVWTIVGQAAQGARDDDLLSVVSRCEHETSMQMQWAKSRMKQAGPQVLVVTRSA